MENDQQVFKEQQMLNLNEHEQDQDETILKLVQQNNINVEQYNQSIRNQQNLEKLDSCKNLQKNKEQYKQNGEKLKKNEKKNQKDRVFNIQIEMKSIMQLFSKEQIQINFNEFSNSDINSKITKDNYLISILGNKNGGKHILMEYLLEQEFEKIKKSGIDIIQNDQMLFLKSNGIMNNLASNYEQIEQYNQLIFDFQKIENQDNAIQKYKIPVQQFIQQKQEDKNFQIKRFLQLNTEHLINSFFYQVGQIIIIVVNEMTTEEEYMIKQLMNYSGLGTQQKKQSRMILVVHNLKNFEKQQNFDQYIENTIFNCFDIERVGKNQQQPYKINKRLDSHIINQNCNSYHLVMGNKNLEIGEKYNQQAAQAILQLIQQFKAKQQQFKIFDNFAQFINKNLKLYADIDIKGLDNNQEEKSFVYDKGQQRIFSQFFQKCPEKSVKIKNLGKTFYNKDYIRQSILDDYDFLPKYQVFNMDKQGVVKVYLEVPFANFLQQEDDGKLIKIKVISDNELNLKIMEVEGKHNEQQIQKYFNDIMGLEIESQVEKEKEGNENGIQEQQSQIQAQKEEKQKKKKRKIIEQNKNEEKNQYIKLQQANSLFNLSYGKFFQSIPIANIQSNIQSNGITVQNVENSNCGLIISIPIDD